MNGGKKGLGSLDGAVYAEIGLKRTWYNKLFSTILKPPRLFINVNLADGSTQRFRLLAGMVVRGIVLSPLIGTVADFRSFFTDRSPAEWKRVRSLSLEKEDGVGGVRPAFDVRFYRIAPPLPQIPKMCLDRSN